MKNICLLLLLVGQVCYSHTQVLISQNAVSSPVPVKGLVLQTNSTNENIQFKICTVNFSQRSEDHFEISDCKVMGRMSGYSILDIENRILEIEKENMTQLKIQGGYVILGVLVGSFVGGVAGQQLAMLTKPSQMYALISYFATGVVVGGGVGTTLAILSKKNISEMVSPYFHSDEKNVLSLSQKSYDESVSLVVLKNSLQKTVNDFQEVLLGIP